MTTSIEKDIEPTFEELLKLSPGPNMGSVIDFLELRNNKGHTSKVIVAYNENVQAEVARNPIHLLNWENVGKNTQSLLEDRGIGFVAAKEISRGITPSTIMDISNPQYPISIEILEGLKPRVMMWDEAGNEIHPGDKFVPSSYCVVKDLTTTYNGESWFRGLMNMPSDPRQVSLKYEFGKEFSDMTRYHEFAHCMGADEEHADFIAAKMMLKNHPDNNKALDFLELWKAIRATNTVFFEEMNPAYFGAFIAVEQAVNEFKKTEKIHQNDEELWSEAFIRKNFESKAVSDVVIKVQKEKDFVLSDGFHAVAEHLKKESKKSPTKKHRDIALKISNAMNLMDEIIYMPKESGLSLSP